MNKKMAATLEGLAQEQGLSFDPQNGVLYGNRGGYGVCVEPIQESYRFTVTVSVSRRGEPPAQKELKQIVAAYKSVGNVTATLYKVTFVVKSAMGLNKNLDHLRTALENITSALREAGFENSCQTCGKPGDTSLYYVGGSPRQMCAECSQQVSGTLEVEQQQEAEKRENVIGGAVGALLGSLLGAVCIVVISQLGYVAALSGVVMGVCTIKGYGMLGGKLSKKGVLISAIIMIAMVFFANQADWAITVAAYFEVDIATAFRSVGDLLAEGVIDGSVYYANLAMSYLFTLLGAVPTVWNVWKQRKKKFEVYKVS